MIKIDGVPVIDGAIVVRGKLKTHNTALADLLFRGRREPGHLAL